jgi:hypothetical protein
MIQNPFRLIYLHHFVTCDTLTGDSDVFLGNFWGEGLFLNSSVCNKYEAQSICRIGSQHRPTDGPEILLRRLAASQTDTDSMSVKHAVI